MFYMTFVYTTLSSYKNLVSITYDTNPVIQYAQASGGDMPTETSIFIYDHDNDLIGH